MTTGETILVCCLAFIAGWYSMSVGRHIDRRRYGAAASDAFLALWWGALAIFYLGRWL